MSSYVRADGTRVVEYKRGKGARPRENKTKPIRKQVDNIDYRVIILFNKGQESHTVESDSIPGAAYGGLQSQIRAEIPRAIRIKEAKG